MFVHFDRNVNLKQNKKELYFSKNHVKKSEQKIAMFDVQKFNSQKE